MVHNREVLEERKQVRTEKRNELQTVRDALKAKLQEQDINIEETFKRFDRNGDGVFSHMEFEMIFTVMDIQFSKDQLRLLTSLTDKNKDGKIDANEFHRMLYAEDISASEKAVTGIQEDDEDF